MYRESPSLPSINSTELVANKYYNRIHYYKLLDNNGNEVKYIAADKDDRLTDESISLYRKFFNDDGTQKQEYKVGRMSYDIYLMHDSTDTNHYKGIIDDELLENWEPKWYVVLISRETVDTVESDYELLAPEINIEDMTVEYQKSDNKWLINRMEYIDAAGVNHFLSTDIIVGTVNNVELPFILTHGCRWSISPFSLGMQPDSEVESSSNTFIMSLGGDNTGYDPGYYNITVRYSLDGTVQNQRKHVARILVKK